MPQDDASDDPAPAPTAMPSPPTRLHLVDLQAPLVAAWRGAFAPFGAEVAISHGDILEVAGGSVVSPANGYGFMDGGIDLHYLRFFGADLEQRVQAAIGRRPEGHLPVGASLTVATNHPRIPWLIVAPTMLFPEAVPKSHAYRALRAALRLAQSDPERHGEVYCPGLGTGVGAIPPEMAAAEMAEAYGDWRAALAERMSSAEATRP